MEHEEHPTVRQIPGHDLLPATSAPPLLESAWLKQLVLEAGADDVGFVEINNPELNNQRETIMNALPRTKTLISFVVRMNREAIKTPARSIANLEFHHTGDQVNEVGRHVVRSLENKGIRALNITMGFPMEMSEFPDGQQPWIVSHKPVAIAAGLGRMGIHRLIIHPIFGNFILLGTILVDAEVTLYSQPISYNPCLECKLCVAACPVGAISPTGDLNFSACYTHNYREFMGGFTDWVETVVDSRNAKDYRHKVTDSESASLWQSLAFGANYKAAYCMSVCPAGEDVIGLYLADKKAYLKETVRPLQVKKETIYVLKNSDAADHVVNRFPHKQIKLVGNSLRASTISGFLQGVSLTFQTEKSKGLNAVYHFTFTGNEQRQATIVIQNQKLSVAEGHVGEPNLRIIADAQTWLGFLKQERFIVWALLLGKIRLKGSLKLLIAFGKCFPR